MISNARKEIWLKRLLELKVAGSGEGHTRSQNIDAINAIKQGKSKCLLGFDEIRNMQVEQILALTADITKCSKDISFQEGEGYISPEATLLGLINAAGIIARECSGKNCVLATGHPGAMLGFYMEVAELIEERGGKVICPAEGAEIRKYLCPHCCKHDVTERIDYLQNVAVITNGDTLLHTHDTVPMEIILNAAEQEQTKVELVFADHGFAGEAAKRGIQVITVMDTNDPALAVAKHLGYSLKIIPLNDNRPNYIEKEVGLLLKEIVHEFD